MRIFHGTRGDIRQFEANKPRVCLSVQSHNQSWNPKHEALGYRISHRRGIHSRFCLFGREQSSLTILDRRSGFQTYRTRKLSKDPDRIKARWIASSERLVFFFRPEPQLCPDGNKVDALLWTESLSTKRTNREFPSYVWASWSGYPEFRFMIREVRKDFPALS